MKTMKCSCAKNVKNLRKKCSCPCVRVLPKTKVTRRRCGC